MKFLYLLSFLFVLFLGPISAGFCKHTLGCSEPKSRVTGISHSDVQNSSQEPPLNEHSDCGCPDHRVHRCCSIVMFDRFNRPHILVPEITRGFLEALASFQAEPFLDGPFYPPRLG